MMRSLQVALLLGTCVSCAAVAGTSTPVSYGGSDTRVGVRRTDTQFDEDPFEPIDRQTGFAVTLDHVGPSGSGWEVLAGRTEESLGTLDVEIEEISLGYRQRFGNDLVSTFVGLGAAYLDADLRLGGAPESDNSVGAYGQIGLHFEISQTAALEVGARGVFGTEIETAAGEADVDYFQWFVGLTFGL